MTYPFLLLSNLFLSLLLLQIPLKTKSFTVIMSDSTTPKTLVDAPQTGFTMTRNGARTHTREQEAVYDIMLATGNSWATDIPDVCRGRWHGIECMPDKDNVFHVVSLSFGALSDDTAFPTCDNPRSYISESVTKLPYLRTLFFYRCLDGNPRPIPKFLGRLGPSLQTLVLRENGHVGPIPDELGNLTRLRVLDLHGNRVNGSIPGSLGRVNGLRSLDLGGNRLMGHVPDFVLPYLNVLDLSQNLLSGPIPSSIGLFRSLVKIDFSHNGLDGPIPNTIMGLKELILLDLSFNRLNGPLPNGLTSLGSLQVLNLKDNPTMSTTIPSNSLQSMKNLVFLILSNINLQGPIPSSLTQLPKIRVIHLDRNKLNGSIPDSFRQLKYLSELRINDNQLSGPIPLDKDIVWKMGKKLRLNNNVGLCFKYANNNGDFVGDEDLLMDWGIGYCNNSKSSLGRKVEHISTSSSSSNSGEMQHQNLLHKSMSYRMVHTSWFLQLLFIGLVMWL